MDNVRKRQTPRYCGPLQSSRGASRTGFFSQGRRQAEKVFQYREKCFSILTFFVRHTKETSVYTLKWIRACVSFAPFSVHLAVFC